MQNTLDSFRTRSGYRRSARHRTHQRPGTVNSQLANVAGRRSLETRRKRIGWYWMGYEVRSVQRHYPARPNWEQIRESTGGFSRPSEGQEGHSERGLGLLFERSVKYTIHKRAHIKMTEELNQALDTAKKAIITRYGDLSKHRPLINEISSQAFDETET